MPEKEKVYQVVAKQVGQGAGWTTRRLLAQAWRIHKTTAQAHLERCARDGLLIKYWGYESEANQYGWIYKVNDTVPMFPELEGVN